MRYEIVRIYWILWRWRAEDGASGIALAKAAAKRAAERYIATRPDRI